MTCWHCHSDPDFARGDGGPGNSGGFGYPPRRAELSDYASVSSGYLDADGYLYIVDRLKDMVNAGGYSVYPREVEEVIYELDDVVEVAVFGVPDEYRGETVKAAVVLKPDSSLTADDLAAHCARHLAAYKVPKTVEVVDAMPRSAATKVNRGRLVEARGG